MGLPTTRLGQDRNARVHIVETLGQLPQLYALASVTIVGGSLVPGVGGHTPYEPIRADSAIISGQSTANFATEFEALDAANAGLLAQPNTLSNAMIAALENSQALAETARTILPPIENPDHILAKLTADLDPSP